MIHSPYGAFDALKGFSEAVSSKEVQYVSRIELDADEEADLSRKLELLHNLTWNGRMAKANHVMISVKYFVPCQDENNFAFLFMASAKVSRSSFPDLSKDR